MKFHDLTFFAESVANKPLDTDSTGIPGNLKIIRLIDYIATGIDESFVHESSNVGGKAHAKTRDNNRGAYSTHKDVCLSCVNSIVSKEAMNSFNGLKLEDVLVPRIPAEFKGDTENTDTEWDFIEKCEALTNIMSDGKEITINTKGTYGKSITSVFGIKNAGIIDEKTKFNKFSLLFGYMIDENKVVFTGEDGDEIIDIAPGYINLDDEMKYLDYEVESRRESAKKLLQDIYAAKEDKFKTDENNSRVNVNNIKKLLEDFKREVPEDGDIFMSSKEIEKYLSLFEYFNKDKKVRESDDKFFNILNNGMNALEKEGVHFGEHLNVAGDIQNMLMQGGYDITIGYSEAGDTQHTEIWSNKGEQIFVGYVTGYSNQKSGRVIPIYMATKNSELIKRINSIKGKKVHISEIPGNSGIEITFKKLNTTDFVKRTGGNDIIFQLPVEIINYSEIKSKPVKDTKNSQLKLDIPETPKTVNNVEKEQKPSTPKESPTVTQEPEAAPKVGKKRKDLASPETSDKAPVETPKETRAAEAKSPKVGKKRKDLATPETLDKPKAPEIETPKVGKKRKDLASPETSDKPKDSPVIAPKETETANVGKESKASESTPETTGKKEGKTESQMDIVRRLGSTLQDDRSNINQVARLIRQEINDIHGKSINIDSILNALNKHFPTNELKSTRNDLLGDEMKNTKLAKSALPRVKQLFDLGYNFTEADIDNLVERGLNRSDVENIVRSSTK